MLAASSDARVKLHRFLDKRRVPLKARCPPKPVGTACDELSRVVADPTVAQSQSFWFDQTCRSVTNGRADTRHPTRET